MRAIDIGIEDQLRCDHILQLDRAGITDPSIVDQNVYRAACNLFRFGNTSGDLFIGLHVNLDHMQIKFFRVCQRLKLARFRARQIAHCGKNLGPLAREIFSHQPSEAGRTSGDEDAFAVHVVRDRNLICLREAGGGCKSSNSCATSKKAATGNTAHDLLSRFDN